MDASLKSFLTFRVERLKEISLEIAEKRQAHLVSEICDEMARFCINRPDTPFFNKAEGTKLIRKDLKYFFPATFGFDLRKYTTGSNLDFKHKKYLAHKDRLSKQTPILLALSRLIIMIMTYDLLTVEIDESLDVDDVIIEKANAQNDKFLSLLTDYLTQILDIPPHAQKLHLSKGNIHRKIQAQTKRDNHATILSWIEAGTVPLNINKLDKLFETICRSKNPQITIPSLALDSGNRIIINLAKLQRHPAPDQTLLKTVRFRYHLTSYLYAASYYRQPREKRDVLLKKVSNTLQDLPDLPKERIADLADFLIGDRSKKLQRKVGFHFDPLPDKSAIDWQQWERESVFLGEKPDNPKISPQHIQLPQEIKKSLKKPVCIMLDVSASMSDCLDIAMKSLGNLFAKLNRHPINIVLFSSCAGVLNKGIPVVSRGLPLSQEIPWLFKMVDATRKGLFLGGTTSIGNGILLGKAIALGMAEKMKKHKHWMQENAIACHCILISDNLHNTPRDITETNATGNYLLDSPENVIEHTILSGCSIHNLICCSPTSKIDRIVYKMQVIRYLEILTHDYFQLDSPGIPTARAIEKDLVMTVLSNKPKTILFQYRNDEDSFSLVNSWAKSPVQDKKMQAIAGFVVFLRKKLRQNERTYDALDFIGREFGLEPQHFLQNTINMDKVFKIFQLTQKDSEVVLEDLDLSIIDASPLQIFEISHCIAETQRRIVPFSTTPVITKMNDQMDRRKAFDNELYFGLKNLERLDSGAETIVRQIEAMA
ncbi:MAG: VWA domain-containing protein [Deltaproteobacteria bacterium]|nr:VWA domain-containing protein [Deltaproteobacteria bacterium]